MTECGNGSKIILCTIVPQETGM